MRRAFSLACVAERRRPLESAGPALTAEHQQPAPVRTEHLDNPPGAGAPSRDAAAPSVGITTCDGANDSDWRPLCRCAVQW